MDYFKVIYKISFCFIFLIIGCKKQEENDFFVKKYQNHSFSKFRNIYISYRGTVNSLETYLISKKEGDLPVYIVNYDSRTKKIVSIDKSNLLKSNTEDYFTENQIKELFKSFLKYDFYVLGSDVEGNVYINPYYSNSPPYFMKLNKFSKIKYIKKGFIYKHYKDNWYINLKFIEDSQIDYKKLKKDIPTVNY